MSHGINEETTVKDNPVMIPAGLSYNSKMIIYYWAKGYSCGQIGIKLGMKSNSVSARVSRLRERWGTKFVEYRRKL